MHMLRVGELVFGLTSFGAVSSLSGSYDSLSVIQQHI
jgi:hypothetical protein